MTLPVALMVIVLPHSMLALGPQQPATTAATEKATVKRRPVAVMSAEVLQNELTATSTDWDALKLQVEQRHSQGRIRDADFASLMRSYQTRGTRSRVMASKMAARSTTTTSSASKTTAMAEVFASRTSLAKASVVLAAADQAERRDVATFSQQSKAAMLESLKGPDLEPLRAYVQDRFPPPPAGADFDTYSAQVKLFSTGIENAGGNANSIAKDLTVTSQPAGAKVKIYPKFNAQNSREENTQANFANLYIGLYALTVTAPGHKTYEGELDWLNNLQPLLNCTLVQGDAADASTCVRPR